MGEEKETPTEKEKKKKGSEKLIIKIKTEPTKDYLDRKEKRS